MVVHACNPRTWEAEAGLYLSLDQPGLQSEFQPWVQRETLSWGKKRTSKYIHIQTASLFVIVCHHQILTHMDIKDPYPRAHVIPS